MKQRFLSTGCTVRTSGAVDQDAAGAPAQITRRTVRHLQTADSGLAAALQLYMVAMEWTAACSDPLPLPLLLLLPLSSPVLLPLLLLRYDDDLQPLINGLQLSGGNTSISCTSRYNIPAQTFEGLGRFDCSS